MKQHFPRTFWIANIIELFERFAWYGMFMVLALYLTNSPETGALGFSQSQKGALMGSVVGILYFLPLLTGALADKFGYKKVLIFALSIYVIGYILMGEVRSYALFYIVFLFLAIGAALFKPIIAATISRTTTIITASVGFGIYYMMVNVGSFMGPLFSSKLRGIGWKYVFFMAAFLSLMNLLLIIFFYKEPTREKQIKESFSNIFKSILKNLVDILKEKKLLFFLLLIISFWTIYNQLFYALPVFIEQWVHTAPLYNWLHGISPMIANLVGTNQGTIEPEMITNLDAGFIIILQVLISNLVKKYLPLKTILQGVIVASIGIILTYFTQSVLFLIVGIFIFSIGEMTSSPKITEYVGSIAPEGKTALYMGSSFLPMAFGNFFAGLISGGYYTRVADKFAFIKRELLEHHFSQASLKGLSNQKLLDIIKDNFHMTENQVTDMLWNKYHPDHYWYLLVVLSLITIVGLFIYGRIFKGTS